MSRLRLGGGPDIQLRDLPGWGLLPLWAAGIWTWVHAIVFPYWMTIGADSVAYYVTRHHEQNLYWLPPMADGAYLYSPAFAQVIWPFTWLPWGVFAAAWALLEAAVLAWLLAPLGLRWGAPLFLLATALEIPLGNVYPLLALVAVVGLRRPAAWSFAVLTKVTPGVGALWFAGRREWRSLAVAGISTVVIAACSWLIAPQQWADWIHFLGRNNTGVASVVALVRYLGAAALTLWAATRNKVWAVPVAMALATPLPVPATLVVLAAIPRLMTRAAQPEPTVAGPAPEPVAIAPSAQ